MTISHPIVTAIVSLPGTCHNVELHGPPQAGQTYLRNGVPVSDITLGDPADGCAYGNASSPKLTATSLDEWDALIAAAQLSRARMSLWFADHPAVA